jgi:hypothetical protein
LDKYTEISVVFDKTMAMRENIHHCPRPPRSKSGGGSRDHPKFKFVRQQSAPNIGFQPTPPSPLSPLDTNTPLGKCKAIQELESDDIDDDYGEAGRVLDFVSTDIENNYNSYNNMDHIDNCSNNSSKGSHTYINILMRADGGGDAMDVDVHQRSESLIFEPMEPPPLPSPSPSSTVVNFDEQSRPLPPPSSSSSSSSSSSIMGNSFGKSLENQKKCKVV